MASGCESLSNIDLRKKLLEYGYDIPISVKKDFMLKTLEKAMTDKSKNQPPASTRKSLPPAARNSVERNNSNNNHETESNASSHSRRSSGSGRASLPAAARAQPLQQRVKSKHFMSGSRKGCYLIFKLFFQLTRKFKRKMRILKKKKKN
jgi:hypothetical protein